MDLVEDPTAAGLGPRTLRALEAICSTLGRGKVSAVTRGPRRNADVLVLNSAMRAC